MHGTTYGVACLLVASTGTALACGLGTVPVLLLGDRVEAWLGFCAAPLLG